MQNLNLYSEVKPTFLKEKKPKKSVSPRKNKSRKNSPENTIKVHLPKKKVIKLKNKLIESKQ